MLSGLKRISLSMILLSVITSLLFVSGCTQSAMSHTDATTSTSTKEQLQVHFIDVGQADSILLKSPTGQTLLIDGGNNDDGQTVVNYLKSQGVKELTAVVATHPHEDHIGGLDEVIKHFPTKNVYMPKAESNTRTFEDFIAAVNSSGAKKIQAKAGVNLNFSDLTGVFLAPNSSHYDETNNYSAVLKVTYGNVAFLFTGDAEDISEAEMLKNGQFLKANVLKVGHHGSTSSTTPEFLKAVSPEYGVISVGTDNDYGHPKAAILDRLGKAGVKVYRTDRSGTIVAKTDGETISFDKAEPPIASQDPAPVLPATSSDGSVEIVNIDLKGEVVTIKNKGSKEVNLDGWKLVSESGDQTYVFPSNTMLPAGGTLNVVSGKTAKASQGTLVWTLSYIWKNDGDPGVLYDAQGNVVSKR